MDGPRDYHTKWRKSERERQISYDIAYMWNLKWYKWTYLQKGNRLTDIENKLIVMEGEMGFKNTYIKYINNKDLLYSTGNYIQYPVINHNGKEYEKEYICVHIYDIWINFLYTRN